MFSHTDFALIAALDLNPIKVKLMHKQSGEGWTRAKADAMEIEYRRFLYLMKAFPNEMTAPLVDVDTFWHYHILDTMKYASDCEQAFGYFLHHYPYVGLEGEDGEQVQQQAGQRMQELYETTFGEAYVRAQPANDGLYGLGPIAANGAWYGPGAQAAGTQTAWCGSPSKSAGAQAAWCGSPSVQAADVQTAWCGSPSKPAGAATAWCGSPSKAAGAATAWCGSPSVKAADVQSAWCGSPSKAAGTATAWCGSPSKAVGAATAWCGSPSVKAADVQTAWCGSPAGSAAAAQQAFAQAA